MHQVFQRSVVIAAQGRLVESELAIPESASGIVIIAHDGGGHLHGSRHQHVVSTLHQKGVASLRLDPLAAQEELATGWGQEPRLDLLASHLLVARDWLVRDQELRYLPLGYFGSEIGAAAALVAAARQPQGLTALVSSSGRLELALDVLPQVRAPTQLIVAGDEDADTLRLNQKALDALRVEKSLRIVPHASHRFDEPGALEEMARLAGDWFARLFRDATQMRYGWTDELGRWV